VRPPSPLNDALNGASVNAELNPELLLSDAAALVANPNLPHLCRGERGGRKKRSRAFGSHLPKSFPGRSPQEGASHFPVR
jgi:hypothetical protein